MILHREASQLGRARAPVLEARHHFCISNQGMKSVLFHSRDNEVALNTRDANRKRLADDAISALSAWKVSHLSPRRETSGGK